MSGLSPIYEGKPSYYSSEYPCPGYNNSCYSLKMVPVGLNWTIGWSFRVQLVVCALASVIELCCVSHTRDLHVSQYVVSVESSSLTHHRS